MKYLTVKEVAELLRVNRFTVYRHIRKHSIPSVRIGGKILVDKEELIERLKVEG